MMAFQEINALAPSICDFGLSLLRKCEIEEHENVLISPFGISTALAMLVLGADGASKTQIVNAMNITDVADEDLQKYFQSFIKDSLATASCVLQVANGAFVAKNYELLEKYCSILKDYFEAEFKNVDFSSDESRQYINQWVQTVTEGKIQDLLASGSIDEYTKLVLVNAVYFKGLWKIPFKPQLTKTSTFYVSTTETIEVDMMRVHKVFNYGCFADLHCSCIELPYEEDNLSMVILLPDEIEGLQNLESVINFDGLQSILSSCSKRKVTVSLPKFKVESSLTLDKTLEKVGIRDIFSNNADLSGINGNRELQVSSVIHKSFVEVNEEGTEAAAATAMFSHQSALIQTLSFIVNHPFMLLILNRNSGNILFMGKIFKV